MRLFYFQFLPLSDFLHLKSANIKTVSSIFSFIYKFAFVERSRTMKAPVGLLSDRTVLRSKMEGLCPDKFRVVELSRVYHTIPQSASKTKRTTDRSRWFLSSGGGWSIRNFTSQAPASFRSALVGACLLQTLPGTSTANWKLSA